MPATVNASQDASAIRERAELGRLQFVWQRYALYGTLLLVIVFFAVIRARVRTLPLERDEGEYAYSGQLLLQGIPPYKLAYNMKLPGTYAAYAVIMAVFGETPAGIRWGVLLVVAATTFLVFLLARYLYGPLAGAVAGSTYAVLSTRSSIGFDGHATHFVTLFAVAGILLVLYAIDRDRTGLLFCSGLLLGVALLMKQHGVLLAVFAAGFWLWTQRRISFRNLVSGSAFFSMGAVLPFVLTCAMMVGAGVFREFWFWTFSYGRAYASEMSLRDGWKMFRAVVPWMLRPALIWEIALIGLTAPIWNRRTRKHAGFSAGLLFFSFLAVCPGFYFRPHYFIVMFPAVALWAGIAVAAACDRLQECESARWLAWLPLFVFAAAFAVSIHGQGKFFFRDPAVIFQALHQNYGRGDGCAEAQMVGNYVRANSSPQDTVAVLGSEPEIYFYSHRHSATGYIYMYALTERQPYAALMRRQMTAEVEVGRPRFVVYVDDALSWWNLGSTKETVYLDPLQRWISERYQLVKQIAVAGDPEHRWGDQASFYVYRRKD